MPYKDRNTNLACMKSYRRNNKLELNIKKQAYRNTHPEVIALNLLSGKRRHAYYKAIIYIALGGSCVCCGEMDYRFLSIDHINGGGNQEQKATHGGTSLLRKIIKSGIPKSKYQLLCNSCNCTKRTALSCPHSDFNVFNRDSFSHSLL